MSDDFEGEATAEKIDNLISGPLYGWSLRDLEQLAAALGAEIRRRKERRVKS